MVQPAPGSGPFLPIEADMRAAGYACIVGIDEAGRGPLAGPVVAAAVHLPVQARIQGLQDSKRLTARQREAVYVRIRAAAASYGIGMVSADLIDQHNIRWATQEAMTRAVQQLDRVPDLLLIDGTDALSLDMAQRTLVRGDALCASIAAASVLAKVTRDRLMVDYAARYPEYGFERHKGYPTREHYACIRLHGPCAIHRRSFRGVLQGHGPGDEETAMSLWRRSCGQRGEQIAVDYLQQNGYRIQHQNYRCRCGEIDIIAWDGSILVFIEVKTKGQMAFGAPQDMVDRRKQRTITRVAMTYVQQHRLQDVALRFDVVAIALHRDGTPDVTHVPAAFSAQGNFFY